MMDLVGAAGFEPATVGLEIRCSIRLSYAPSITYRQQKSVVSVIVSVDSSSVSALRFNGLSALSLMIKDYSATSVNG
jgi:hypothetical protein